MPTLINRLLSHRDRLAEAVRFVEHLGVRPGLSAFWSSRNGKPANSSENGSVDVDPASLARPLTQVLVDLAAHYGADADPIGLAIALPRVDGDLDARAAPIALARLGLQARWSLAPLLEIEALHLPAALELADGGYLFVATRPDPETLEVRSGDGAMKRIALASLVPRVTGRLLVLGAADPINGATDADDRAALAKGPRRWILLRFLQDRAIVGQLILASVILNLCSLAMPLFQRAIYDRVIPNLALDSLWALSIGAVIALAFEFALRGARSNFIEAQGLRVAQQVQARVMTAVLQAQLAKAPRNTGAALVALRDIEGMALLAPAAIATFLVDLPFFLIFVAAIALIAGPIALCVVAGAVALVVIGLASLKGAGAASARNIQLSRARNNLVVDVVDGLSTIKANQAEGKFARQWAVVCDHLAMSGHDVRKTSEVAMSASGFAVQAVTVAAIIVGVLLVKAGDLSAGALIASTLLAGRAMAPISTAVALSTRAYQSLSQFKAMAELLALPPEREDPRASIAHAPRLGRYDLRNVEVTYEGSEEPALRDVSLKLEAGERIGVIGRSGSGKTTLLQILAGLAAPTRGSILVDGHNLHHFRMETIRTGIAYAAQDACLFDAPLRDNVTLGVTGLDADVLERSVRLSGVDQIAQSLPDGFSTRVGPRGSRLSGGQRQAVILARAFARRAPVLLLDEPTAAMDIQTEQNAIAGIRAAADGATLIIATHRIELLSLVDRVIWLDAGRVIADRPRDEILAAFAARSNATRRGMQA